MQSDFFTTYKPPLKLDTTSCILKVFERSGFEKVKSHSRVLHHFRKDNEDYGFIILRKTRDGFFLKMNMSTHFVDNAKMDAFSRHDSVFVIIIEKFSSQTLIACLGKLWGYSGDNNEVPGTYFPRQQFIFFDSIVSKETKALDTELHEINEYGVCVSEIE